MPAVALVTTDPAVINGEDMDVEILSTALEDAAIEVSTPMWRDEAVDWAVFDLVVMRSPWDYPERLAEFRRWLHDTARVARILNPPRLIEWNLDKSYLLDLEARGVRIVNTTICDDVAGVTAAVRAVDATEVIVKPNVSAGSRDTGRFRVDDPAAGRLADLILRQGKRVLVQPCLSSVSTEGERALVYFAGRFSHALRKGPILALGGGLVGGTYTEEVQAIPVDAADRALADTTMTAVHHAACSLGLSEADAVPLYARIDVASGDDGPVLLEAELFEPSYFLPTAPGAERAFVRAVLERLT
ncbi:MAG: ATP-grasp domain-containing protein [Microthrixaceae bacterium]